MSEVPQETKSGPEETSEVPQETKSVLKENAVLDFSSLNDEDELLSENNLKAERTRRTRRRWIIGISLLLIIVIVGSGTYYFLQLRNPTPVTYQFQAVTQQPFSLTASATGSIQANTYSANFTNTGTITSISVEVGDTVTQNQQLAQITLTDGSGATETLSAPHAGVVTAINGHIGDRVSSSTVTSGGNNAFIQITDLSALSIQANVNEADIGKVAVGNTVQFTVSAYSNQTFTGTVSAISPIGKADNGVVTYPVTIQIDQNSISNANLLPNMTANITITTASRTNALLIPAKAVSFANQAPISGLITFNQAINVQTQEKQLLDTLAKAGKDPQKNHYTTAFVVEQVNNKWVVKAVVLGLTDGTFDEVIAGLVSGEKVAVGIQNGSDSGPNNGQLPPPNGNGPGALPGGGPGSGGGLGQ